MVSRAAVAIILCVCLAACTTTPEPLPPAAQITASVTDGLERYLAQRARVESVGFRLRRAGRASCEKRGLTRPELGLVVWSLANFPNKDDQARLKASFGLSENVTVALVVKEGPASAAGLRAGDVLTHVEGEALGSGSGATERFIALSGAAARKGPVRVRRDGDEVVIKPATVCEFPTLLVRSAEVNAAADGRVLAITSGLLDLTRTDDELALILGHELAHNVLGHLDAARTAEERSGGLLDAFLRAMIGTAVASSVAPPFTLAFEKEADYVGLYFMARAGFDVTAAESFWRRLNEASGSASVAKTHPPGPERLRALQATIAEIKAKQKAKKPLEPHLRRPQ